MAHGSWDIVTLYGPWVMGKKSLNGVARKGGEESGIPAQPLHRQLPVWLLGHPSPVGLQQVDILRALFFVSLEAQGSVLHRGSLV